MIYEFNVFVKSMNSTDKLRHKTKSQLYQHFNPLNDQIQEICKHHQ